MESARCKAFIESVERGSFRAAAEALGYTPSAVSQLVAVLEKDLGLNLLYIHTPLGFVPEDRSLRIAVRRFSSLLVCIIGPNLTEVKL